MSEYRRGVNDGFKLGLREGRIKAEDEMREQTKESARLMAAAPELLEALAAASVALSTGHNALIALDKARAAIAKATGEQP
jgi:flagellar biosynthesis/type III secretory pathway protein FliH